MRDLHTTARYRREERLARRRGKDISKLSSIVEKLVSGEPLEPRYRPHQLIGDMAGCWECRIEPDWLLVWDEDESTVTLLRTGTHTDLFGL